MKPFEDWYIIYIWHKTQEVLMCWSHLQMKCLGLLTAAHAPKKTNTPSTRSISLSLQSSAEFSTYIYVYIYTHMFLSSGYGPESLDETNKMCKTPQRAEERWGVNSHVSPHSHWIHANMHRKLRRTTSVAVQQWFISSCWTRMNEVLTHPVDIFSSQRQPLANHHQG